MLDVAILGAGDLGGALAHLLASRNSVRVIRLIDDHARIAEGKALDIAQTAPLNGFGGQVTGSGDFAQAAGADAVIIADRAGGPEWQGDDGVMLLARLHRFAPGAVIICAGYSQRGLVESGVRDQQVDRYRLFGSAPEALVSGARALVALTLDGSVRDVAVTVLGIPPNQLVIPWGEVSVAGFAVTQLLEEPARRQLHQRIIGLWPPGPYALASAAAKAVEAMDGRTRAVLSCFVAPDDSAGRKTRTAALPVRLGSNGIQRVVLPELAVVDRVALDNAILL